MKVDWVRGVRGVIIIGILFERSFHARLLLREGRQEGGRER